MNQLINSTETKTVKENTYRLIGQQDDATLWVLASMHGKAKARIFILDQYGLVDSGERMTPALWQQVANS